MRKPIYLEPEVESIELILDSVRAVRPTANSTESDVKKCIMSWLQHATDRIKAHQKSKAKKSANAGC
ncbi:unnamed protein product [Allacma fusca]|uniref:Uncharacterized protein n=1 Tax=Allacma fusca TaxID=39272 RepID=A0A8J2JIY8_9HEXA|nr:unnamed protein product [Allacma fusca]